METIISLSNNAELTRQSATEEGIPSALWIRQGASEMEVSKMKYKKWSPTYSNEGRVVRSDYGSKLRTGYRLTIGHHVYCMYGIEILVTRPLSKQYY